MRQNGLVLYQTARGVGTSEIYSQCLHRRCPKRDNSAQAGGSEDWQIFSRSPFQRQPIASNRPTSIQKARRVYRNHFLPDSFRQPFFGAGGNGPMDILSHLNSAPFRQFAEMVLDIYNPLALEPTVPELGIILLFVSFRTWLPLWRHPTYSCCRSNLAAMREHRCSAQSI